MAVFNKKNDPIPRFEEKYVNFTLLDSALNNPRQTFGGQDLYPTLEEKASILMYSMIKNHAFFNGNKRIATTSLLVFLFINNYWLHVSNDDLFKTTLSATLSKQEDMKVEVQKLNFWIRDNIKAITENPNESAGSRFSNFLKTLSK